MSDVLSQKIFNSLKWILRWLFDLEIKGEEWQCRVTIIDYSCARLQLKLVFESTDGIVFHNIESFFKYALQAKLLQKDPCNDLKQADNYFLERREIDFEGAPVLTQNMTSTVDILKRYMGKFIQDVFMQLFRSTRSTREHCQGFVVTDPGYFSEYHMGVPQLHQNSSRHGSGMLLSFVEKSNLMVIREVGFSQAAKVCGFEIKNSEIHCPIIARLEMGFFQAQMNQNARDQKKNGLTASKSKNKDSRPGGMKQTRKLAKKNDMQEKTSSNSSSRQATNSTELRSENASRGLKYEASDQDNSPAKESQDPKKDSKSKSSKQRKKKKNPLSENESQRNEYDRALGRLKGQLSRFRQEQALIMAYDAEGWRGASREKIKPHAEITRAKEAVERCKEIIRDCVKVCDHAQGDKPIPKEFFDSDGELDFDNIFCSKCLKSESTDDNDIILCDGLCDRAYHMKCVIPPLDLSILEDEDGWLCPACDRKIDMIDEINDEFGTDYEYEDPWTSILIPGKIPRHKFYDCDSPNQQPGGNTSLLDMELPSDEESDSDYKAKENSSGTETESDNSSGPKSSSETESGSCVSEDVADGIQDVDVNGMLEVMEERFSDSESPKILEGKRKRLQVDYKALNKELFGDIESPELKVLAAVSDSDEDAIWSPSARKRRS